MVVAETHVKHTVRGLLHDKASKLQVICITSINPGYILLFLLQADQQNMKILDKNIGMHCVTLQGNGFKFMERCRWHKKHLCQKGFIFPLRTPISSGSEVKSAKLPKQDIVIPHQ